MDDAERDDYRDPLVEALRRDIDMTLIERNLKLTPQQRLDQLIEMQRFAAELADAGHKAPAPMTDYQKAIETLRNAKVLLRPKDILALAELEALLSASTK